MVKSGPSGMAATFRHTGPFASLHNKIDSDRCLPARFRHGGHKERASSMRLSLPVLLVLGACTAPPPSAYLTTAASGGVGPQPIGQTSSGEECRLAPTGSGGDIQCGDWSSPSARLRVVGSTSARVAAEEARVALNSRLECSPVRDITALGSQPAAVMDCRRRVGGWPSFVLAVPSGGRMWLAEGVLPAHAVAERGIGLLSGRITAESPPVDSASVDQQAQRLARAAFATGDISRFEGLMAVGRDANQAERFVAAETAYRAALALQEGALGVDAPDNFLPMAMLAVQLSNQGRFPDAEALLNRAATLAPRSADPLAPAMMAHYRGLHAANRRQNDAALALFAESGAAYTAWVPPELRGGRRAGLPPPIFTDPLATRALIGMIETRRNSAAVLRAAGRLPEAERASNQAQVMASVGGSAVSADVIGARLSRTGGAVISDGGDAGGAERGFARAAAGFARGIPRSRPLADTLLLRAANVGPDQAAPLCRAAMVILTSLREGTTPARVAPCIDGFIALGTPAGLAEAFEATQLAQGGVTTTQIAIAAARLTAGARDSAVTEALRRREAADRLLVTRYRERDAAAAEGGRTDLSALNALIAEADTAFADADAAAQAAAPGYAQLVQSVASTAEVLGALLPGEAMVTTTLPSDRRGWTFILLDGEVFAGRIDADSAQVAALVERIRASVVSGDASKPFDAEAAYALHQALFAPVAEPYGRAKSLVALPEASLLSLPFSVLVTAAPPLPRGHEGVAFLLQRMAVAQVPAASSLVTLRRAGRSAATRAWFGFGDPRPVPVAFAVRSFPAAPACGRGLASLAQLPATEIELRAAQQIMGASAADMRVGAAFTRDAVRAIALRQFRVVHFATHAVLPSDLTCLTEPALIASATGPDAAQAMITAGSILDLELDADLVVLSACNSGGGAAAGESLSTLARAFFFSGARGLLATHWYVNDSAAAQVAVITLRNIRDGDLPAEALRKAQIGLTHVPGAGHPAFWAPFAIIGPGPGTRAVPLEAGQRSGLRG